VKSACCVIVKNEEHDILEWLLFQFVVGFDTVLFYDDGSTDNTLRIAKAVARRYDVRIASAKDAETRWSRSGIPADRQIATYLQACRDYAGEFDWIAFVDTDEFVVSESGARIGALLGQHQGAAGIALTQLFFGSAGHRGYPEVPVVEAFDRRSDLAGFEPNLHVKSIVRPGAVQHSINPHGFIIGGRYVDPAGAEIVWRSNDHAARADVPASLAWRVNHYFLRSHEHWITKMKRGYWHPDQEREWEFTFNEYDRNDVEDRSAHAYLPELRQRMADFPELTRGRARAAPQQPVLDAAPRGPDPARRVEADLVWDVAMNEGDDAAYYLEKGFTVIGVEADPEAAGHLHKRFPAQIESGEITIVAVGAAAAAMERDPADGGGIGEMVEEIEAGHALANLDWTALQGLGGTPYYCKIGSEGGGQQLLSTFPAGGMLPTYMSVEAQSFAPVERLFEIGYRQFKLVDRTILDGLDIPFPAREGRYVAKPDWSRAAGPFGRELPGGWVDFQEIAWIFQTISKLRAYRTVSWGRYDCHAWHPTPKDHAIRCVMDGIEGNNAFGWAVHRTSPQRVAEFEICLDGAQYTRIRCDINRPDVARAGHGTAVCGFRFRLPDDHGHRGRIEFRDVFGNTVPVVWQGAVREFLDVPA
jgi:glycosyltransferase involved in cell wall biosynthesis